MICVICHGRGVIWRQYRDRDGCRAEHPEPCPSCGGCGMGKPSDLDQPSDRDTEIEQTRDTP